MKTLLVVLILVVLVIIYMVYAYWPSFYAYKGNMAFSKKDLEKARYWYEKAYNCKNANLTIKNFYAIVLLRSGEPQKAEEVLNLILMNKAVKPQKRNEAKQTRCMAIYKQGRLDEAMEECEELFETYKNTIMYGMLGLFKILKGEDPHKILDFCLEAYDYNSDDRDILDNLFIAYYNLGEYDKAREISDTLTERETTFVEGFYHRALLEEKCGNIDLARKMAEEIDDCARSYMTTVSEEEVAELKKRLKM